MLFVETPHVAAPVVPIHIGSVDCEYKFHAFDTRPTFQPALNSDAAPVVDAIVRTLAADSPVSANEVPLLGAANTQFPVLLTLPLSVVLLAHATVLAADRYMPFVGTVPPLTVTRSTDMFATPVMLCEFHGVVAVGRPVPSRRMQLLSAVAMSASEASSLLIAIGGLAPSTAHEYRRLYVPAEYGVALPSYDVAVGVDDGGHLYCSWLVWVAEAPTPIRLPCCTM